MKSSSVGNNTVKTAQDIARNIVRQVAQEPLEILEDAGDQVIGVDSIKHQNNQTVGYPDTQTTNQSGNSVSEQQHSQDKVFANRRMQALQNEVDEIRKQGVFKELQAKISEGENFPLEDYPELSMEQKQVLKAQMEAVKIQQAQAAVAEAGVREVPTIHSKPSRRFGAGQKHEAEKQQTRVEKPVPPSG